MRTSIVVGIMLILLGVFALFYDGIPYKKKESHLEVGPVELHSEVKEEAKLPPYVGIGIIVGGVILLGLGIAKKRKC